MNIAILAAYWLGGFGVGLIFMFLMCLGNDDDEGDF